MTKLILLGLAVSLASCSAVKLDPKAQNVTQASEATSVGKCQFIGDTSVSIWYSSSTFQSHNAVDEQLTTLARNNAAKMNGNMILPKSAITNGQRTYSVYNCPTAQ